MAEARRGRPRSETVQRAILEATRAELGEGGYDRLSFDRIAARAGIAKQTIYRRYPSKNALVADLILQGFFLPPPLQPAAQGDVHDDLRDWVSRFAEYSSDPQTASLIRAATAASAEDNSVAERFRDQVDYSTNDTLAALLRAGAAAGQVRADTPSGTVAEMVVGTLVYRLLTRQELTPEFLQDLTSVVFDGIGPDGRGA
ncbi:TetR/AcrR family transcriptional regulator [Curtobacterium sp. VKM Ac-2887]|uniref:TetR/AcrR family transcriptional regulator n=1 Tax=Curtobacterium sp. VKM Ac-2887 TaxID=2783819 RepID=UPI00188AB608|nr:TetR/AcrR family transcriptional regulator [Curtobacterium sp. VKM Ac-2887]MBF4585701.1 TetR/AcrR family transcriptional regulator [Curtobacterium sp. VKM Ac-2887]